MLVVTEFYLAVDKCEADYRRLEPNSIWPSLKEEIEAKYFGALAHVVKGELVNNNFLREAYIKEFGSHDDEGKYLPKIEELTNQDITIYSPFKKWVDKRRMGAQYVAGFSEAFPEVKWGDLEHPRYICGTSTSLNFPP